MKDITEVLLEGGADPNITDEVYNYYSQNTCMRDTLDIPQTNVYRKPDFNSLEHTTSSKSCSVLFQHTPIDLMHDQ